MAPLSSDIGPGQRRHPTGSVYWQQGGRGRGLRDTAASEIRLDHERRLRAVDREAVGSLPQSHLEEEEQRACLEARRGLLELQGLQGPEGPWAQERGPWAQERGLLQQELRLFRHNTVVFYMKLRWILTHWRLDRRTDSADDSPHQPEFERMEGIPELGVMEEQAGGEDESPPRGDPQSSTPQTPGAEVPDLGALFHGSPETQPHQRQERPVGTFRVQHALLNAQERSRLSLLGVDQFGENRRMLQALRTLLEEFRVEVRDEEARRRQLQRSYANDKAAWEVKWAEMKCQAVAQQEREAHRRLLAESHNASLDLRWKLQHGEKRWGRERAELLERQDHERQEWDSSARDLHRKMERMQRELSVRRAEDGELKDPLAPRSPRSPAFATRRSHSESDDPLAPEDSPGARLKALQTTENLFMDALSLDLSDPDAPPPSRLDSEKRFPCMKEALNEISERETGPAYPEEEMGGGSLLRAKSVCSMSDFQRLMDSSPFLPDKSRHGDQERDDATPPLSPDDLKYIEEFNGKGWDFPSPAAAAGHVPLLEAWASERPAETPAWGNGVPGADHSGVRILHSPPRPLAPSECAATTPPICPTVGYAASLDLQLSRNLSDDMKEVAFSVRNAIRSPPGSALRDTACQTNGFTTRGTQTTQTISVGLQTDALRNLNSSPHRCHTPKGGGSTPISSPSRSVRKVQYSPAVQSKFERPCCSPKYGSPKLQRKSSVSGKAAAPPAAAEPAPGGTRAPAPTAAPQKGNSESAWARSTTTRDSPVHTTINDGLSSLFNIIDHTPVVYEPMQKFNNPVQLIVEMQGDHTPEVAVSVRQDLSAPPGYSLAENAARILNKKLLEQGFREERRLPVGGQGAHGREGSRHGDADRGQTGCIEDLPRSPVAPPLDSCFLRPARPAHRRPPSRWAAHSPSPSPRRRDGSRKKKFTFPPPHSKTVPEQEEEGAGLPEHSPT
ncbi:hypothetical protein NHX12_003910 [Muraenolepis orangiensis]|uniref:SOGA 1/2-like coiled-coil domain-containing protein n=1 Tax=Muraenolepis orangiensis TaxID=630683 RepID=A0A9Q0DW26_9TELE|nr:hypothetical protein NHX12_003910 [Muraenolepis orangiensis]